MEKEVAEYIRKYGMISPGDHILAGVSGGADSVCLLFVLESLREAFGFTLEAVHVEHGIRGEESLRDAAFTEGLCRERGIPFHLYTWDVPARALRERLTLEEAARKCRYESFRKAMAGKERAKIAVAHNQDDQAETVLWNLARGAGLRGLGGMRPVNGDIIRPLLGVSREQVEAYLRKKGQEFCTDSTNLTEEYTRNRLRRQILPALEEGVNVRAKAHIAQAGERLQRAWGYLERQALRGAEQISENRGGELWIDAEEFLARDEVLQEAMLGIFMERQGMGLKDVGAVHIEEIKSLAAGQSGRARRLPGGRTARRTGRFLVLGDVSGEVPAEAEEVLLPVPGEAVWGRYRVRASLEPYKNQRIPEKKYTKWLDYDTITDTIHLRSRRSGDYFMTEGGRRKLKKYFIDEKILRECRGQILLLADGSHIVCIPGRRISSSCKVTERTKTILKIEIMEERDNGRKDSCTTV